MDFQNTSTREEFLNKCEEFIFASRSIDFTQIRPTDEELLNLALDLRNFVVFSCPEMLRLSRIALTLTAE